MENISHLSREDAEIELPPGFRFHPTDEELITHYLTQKVLNTNFCSRIIGEVDLNKVEPWELPWKAKMGEREWYFFCLKDRKYPTGSRTNRATHAGYWKATGKDKEIYRGKSLVGMKKTLVFYKGRAPKGEKSNWVMHEYRLEEKNSLHNFAKTAKNEWVISRIFQKSSGGKRTHISGLMRMRSYGGEELELSNLPPLMDFSTRDDDGQTRPKAPNPSSHVSHVTCFSEQSDPPQNDIAGNFNNPLIPSDSFFSTQFVPDIGNLEYPDSDITRLLIHNNGGFIKRNARSEFSNGTGISTEMSSGLSNHEMGHGYFEDKEDPINSGGPVDLDCLWNY